MKDALAALARGELYMPLRTALRPPDASGLLGLMPSYTSGPEKAYGLETVCVFPQNAALGKDAHQGGVLLFSGETGEL
jgi:ornithine cyclodeaminase